MLRLVRQPTAIEPEVWFVVFHTKAATPFLSRLPIGWFKHVSAFAYVHGAGCWLIYDVQLEGTRTIILPDNPATLDFIAGYTEGCAVLHMRRRTDARIWFRFGFWCVPAMKHLLGLSSSALLPDALFRDCLRAPGTKVIHEPSPVPGAGRSEPAGRDRSGDPGEGGCDPAAIVG
jgi:hypothetical protein